MGFASVAKSFDNVKVKVAEVGNDNLVTLRSRVRVHLSPLADEGPNIKNFFTVVISECS